jgi:hypothetical protein
MTDADTELRDKVIRLETEMAHMLSKVDSMESKVSEMHGLLLQAKGAKYVIVGMAMIGGFVAGKVASIAALFGGK